MRIALLFDTQTPQWKKEDWEMIDENIQSEKISESIELLETTFKGFPINDSFQRVLLQCQIF